MDKEVAEIKAEHFETLKGREVIILARSDYGWDVEHWVPDGVWPNCSYDNANEAAARVLQCLDIREPITPQSWPETTHIGKL